MEILCSIVYKYIYIYDKIERRGESFGAMILKL